jgi:hypothetical protein
MPSYLRNRAWLKAAIVRRVAAGETVAAICAEVEMPTKACVQVWRRGDADFAEALARARDAGNPPRRGMIFDEARAAAFLARVAGGEPINDLLDQPGMPSQRAYRYWRRTQGEFAEALWRLRGARYERRSKTGHGRWRGWDEAVADRLLLAVMRGAPMRKTLATDPAFPSLMVLGRWRSEHAEFDGALRAAMRVGRRAREAALSQARCSPELAEAVGMRIVEGGSLRSIGREAAMPCARTLYGWVARWPAFAREVARACDVREMLLSEQVLEVAERHGPFGLAAARSEANPITQQINRLTKRPGWKRARDAVRQNRD